MCRKRIVPDLLTFRGWARDNWHECYAETIDDKRLRFMANCLGFLKVTHGKAELYFGRDFERAAAAYNTLEYVEGFSEGVENTSGYGL